MTSFFRCFLALLCAAFLALSPALAWAQGDGEATVVDILATLVALATLGATLGFISTPAFISRRLSLIIDEKTAKMNATSKLAIISALKYSAAILVGSWLLYNIGLLPDIDDVFQLAAVLVGPVLAVMAGIVLHSNWTKEERKREIFSILRAAREYILSHDRVRALNLVSVEFDGGGKEKAVVEAWKEYIRHMARKDEWDNLVKAWKNYCDAGNTPSENARKALEAAWKKYHKEGGALSETGIIIYHMNELQKDHEKILEDRDPESSEKPSLSFEEERDRLYDYMLARMADALGSEQLDEKEIRAYSYAPSWHTEAEEVARNWQKELIRVLRGRRAIKTASPSPASTHALRVTGQAYAVKDEVIKLSEDKLEQATWLLEAASEQEDATAQYELAILCLRRHAYNKHSTIEHAQLDAMGWLFRAVENGADQEMDPKKLADAQFQLGIMYEQGYAADKEWGINLSSKGRFAQAKHMGRQIRGSASATPGNPGHKHTSSDAGSSKGRTGGSTKQTGNTRTTDLVIKPDAAKAVEWYKKAHAQGHELAPLYLGALYCDDSKGMKKNTTEANKWLLKAVESLKPTAEKGDPESQKNLCDAYSMLGDCAKTQEDHEAAQEYYAESFKWSKKAAEQGHAVAQSNLGMSYQRGEGVEKKEEKAVEWYTKAAKQGNVRGQVRLGLMYEHGKGVEQDLAEAVKWYTKAAEQEDADGQRCLGVMYEHGRGVEKNEEEAVKWYRAAAEQGDARGQCYLGDMYEHGKGVEQDLAEAVKWYRAAAEQGDAQGQWNLGDMYEHGKGVEKNEEEAVKWYRAAAEQGDAQGQRRLGVMYYNGAGVPKDEDEAVKWIEKAARQGDADALRILGLIRDNPEAVKAAAEQGDAAAQVHLGLMYEHGKGVEQDLAEAVKWYTKAAEQEDADGQRCLGVMYEHGRGVEKNEKEAVKWYTKAAKQDDARGQCYLAIMYEHGKGIEQDLAKAVKWYKAAAEQGDAQGQWNLGDMYEHGKGVEKNEEEAVKWYKAAAEQDDAEGQRRLGVMYYNGAGVPKDTVEAVKWIEKAAKQRDAVALRILEQIKAADEQGNSPETVKAAAERGDPNAQCNLGVMYEYGRGVEKDEKEAVKWYRAAAEQGNARGQCYLATMYESGKGVEQDLAEAVKWYRAAAEQGDAQGQWNLGDMYEHGKGVEQDLAEAVKWYRAAAEQGDAQGQRRLGVMYYNGRGVPEDKDEAVKWIEKAARQGDAIALRFLEQIRAATTDPEMVKVAAEQGNPDAQCNLGVMYEYGKGVEKDEKEAVKWYTKAAEQGDARGQCYLAIMYEHGKGIEQDLAKAVKWYTKAAEQEDVLGQRCLGVMYYNGKGVPEDKVEACVWFILAARGGDKRGAEFKEQIKEELTTEQFLAAEEEADRRAKELAQRNTRH